MADRRGLLILLVIATLAIFIGLVWVIAKYLPFNSAASPTPSNTTEASRMGINCVSPYEYWMFHPEYYPQQMVIAGKVYLAKEIKGVLEHQVADLPAVVQAQLVAAYLNILAGADPSYIQATIFDAYGWLEAHPSGSVLEAGDEEDGFRLYNLLEAYNHGQTGVGPCKLDYPILETQIGPITETQTATFTATQISSETISASETPLPTDTETFAPIYTYVLPSKTPIKTTQAPIYSSPVPTQIPAPTNTTRPSPAPVTNTPLPTEPIPPTVAPTEPPLPTP